MAHHSDAHITEHHFGAHHLIKYSVDDSSRSCFYGFVKFPRLRQYFVFDPEVNKRVLIREKDTRKISWTELFYDLIYVVLIEHLVHFLSENPDHVHIFVLLFGAVWRVWAATTMYSTRYDTDDIIHKIYYLLQMTAVVGMGVNLHDAQESPSTGFTLSYLAAKLLLIVMYIYTAYCEGKRWHNALYLAILNTVLIVPWACSLILPEYGYICWAVSLVAEELAIFVSVNVPYSAPLNIEHYIERVGVFIMLLLGMMVVALLAASENHDLSGYLGAFIPLFIAFALKWTYFDIEGAPKALHAIRKSRYGYILWMFCHLPLMVGICFASSGLLLLEHTISDKHDEHPCVAQWMISGGVGSVMISMGLMGYLSRNYSNFVVPTKVRLPLRIAIGTIVVLLGFTHRMETTVQFLVIVMALVFGFTLFELIGSVQRVACTTHMQRMTVGTLLDSSDSNVNIGHSQDDRSEHNGSDQPLLDKLEETV